MNRESRGYGFVSASRRGTKEYLRKEGDHRTSHAEEPNSLGLAVLAGTGRMAQADADSPVMVFLNWGLPPARTGLLDWKRPPVRATPIDFETTVQIPHLVEIELAFEINIEAGAPEPADDTPAVCEFLDVPLDPIAPRALAAKLAKNAGGFPASLILEVTGEFPRPTRPPIQVVVERAVQPVIEIRPSRAKSLLGAPALWAALAMPLLLPTLFYVPKVPSLGPGMAALRQLVRGRARVQLAEDFRDGLRLWTASGGWNFDAAGFPRPGMLALHRQSIPLADYRMEFLGVIERKSLGFAYRAKDSQNYHAARILIVKPGPIPEVVLERYAVTDGHDGEKTQVRLPFPMRMDTLLHVQVLVEGDHFETRINEQFVDAFNDDRLRSGGVGFFSREGEAAHVCWLRVTHQDDLAGRICSLFAPRLAAFE